MLQSISKTACDLLYRYRPSIYRYLNVPNYVAPKRVFNLFHFFMAPLGVTSMHRDVNDFITFLFIIHCEEGGKGGLEVGGADALFKADIGDAILMDADVLFHASRDYSPVQEDIDDRMVGIFVVHKTFLRLLGLSNQGFI